MVGMISGDYIMLHYQLSMIVHYIPHEWKTYRQVDIDRLI